MLLMLSARSTVGSAGSTGAAEAADSNAGSTGATEVGRGANLDGATTKFAVDAAATSEHPSDRPGKEVRRRLRRWSRNDPPGRN